MQSFGLQAVDLRCSCPNHSNVRHRQRGPLQLGTDCDDLLGLPDLPGCCAALRLLAQLNEPGIRRFRWIFAYTYTISHCPCQTCPLRELYLRYYHASTKKQHSITSVQVLSPHPELVLPGSGKPHELLVIQQICEREQGQFLGSLPFVLFQSVPKFARAPAHLLPQKPSPPPDH